MRKFFLYSTFFVVSTKLFACDICGNSAMNFYGVLPQYNKNFVSLKYSYRNFESKHPENNIINGSLTSTENYSTTDLWSRFYLTKKIQVFAFLPYHYFKKTEQNSKLINAGLGDFSATTNYTLLNTNDSAKTNFKQTLLIGVGIKLPTGKFKNVIANPNMQLGSKSFDYIVNSIYTVRYKKAGLNNEASYRINTKNKSQYKFGNRLTLAQTLFYTFNTKNLKWQPNVGYVFETMNKDYSYNSVSAYTGGYGSFITFGNDFYFRNISISINYQKPINQNLFEGYTKTKQRVIANFIYLF